MKNRNSRIRIALIVAGLLAAGGVRADAITDNAKALLDKGDAKAAYALLEPLEPQRAGDPDYDFLLGLSALETGKTLRILMATVLFALRACLKFFVLLQMARFGLNIVPKMLM